MAHINVNWDHHHYTVIPQNCADFVNHASRLCTKHCVTVRRRTVQHFYFAAFCNLSLIVQPCYRQAWTIVKDNCMYVEAHTHIKTIGKLRPSTAMSHYFHWGQNCFHIKERKVVITSLLLLFVCLIHFYISWLYP